MAKIHIICGNCGANDQFEWEYIKPECDGDVETVAIHCKNCSTIHWLDEKMPKLTPANNESKQ